jgi:DNA processing protein
MLSERQILILNSLPKIGRKSIFKINDYLENKIIDDYNFKETILNWAFENKMIQVDSISFQKAEENAEAIIENSEQRHIKMYGFWNVLFPENLRKIKEPPVMLHVVGDINILSEKRTVAIIGTREPSDYGFKAGRRLAQVLAMKGFVVVSGLAKGCDTAAHTGCLLGNGKTIAVMAHGLDTIYPSINKDLAAEIVSKAGAIVSEYPVGQKAFGNLFVERDRLQSGLSQATIVIQTDIKGGTMHTVKFTEEENKILACLSFPNEHNTHPKVNGNIMLIKEGRAASLGTADDIQNFVHKIYDRIGYVEPTQQQSEDLVYSETLFNIEEYIIEHPEETVEKPKKKKRKAKSKNSSNVIQGMIWE